MWTEKYIKKKKKQNKTKKNYNKKNPIKMKYSDITNHSKHTQFIRPLERLFKFNDLD